MYEMIKKSKTSGTIQCVRKRVRGNGDSIQATDLFYDKSNAKYYKNMREQSLSNDCQINQQEYAEYEKGNSKDRSSQTIFLPKLADRAEYIKPPISRVQAMGSQSSDTSGQQMQDGHDMPLYSGRLVSAGDETPAPPTVRLYSEAEMTHASTLAETLTSPARYSAFRRIGYEDLPDVAYSGSEVPLIKATEYDDRLHVMARYSSDQKSGKTRTKAAFMKGRELAVEHMYRFEGDEDALKADQQAGQERLNLLAALADPGAKSNFDRGYYAVIAGWKELRDRLLEREGNSSLEVSYGGKTGDMTAEHASHPHQRQYSLIQSTFFWLPGEDSISNARAILNFFLNHVHKLEPGGIIRVVSFSSDVSEQDWEGKYNQYEKAADWVCARLQGHADYSDVRKTLLYDQGHPTEKKSYSTKLAELELNPLHDGQPIYKPLWTDTRKVVGAGGERNGNLILQARKRNQALGQGST